MFASILLELVCVCVEEVLKDVWVLSGVIQPLVEMDPRWSDKTSNAVSSHGGRTRLPHGLLLIHPRQDVSHNIRFSGNERDCQIEFLKSVKPSNLLLTRLCHGVQVSETRVVGEDLNIRSVEVMLPFVYGVYESQELFLEGRIVDFMFFELPRCANNQS